MRKCLQTSLLTEHLQVYTGASFQMRWRSDLIGRFAVRCILRAIFRRPGRYTSVYDKNIPFKSDVAPALKFQRKNSRKFNPIQSRTSRRSLLI